MNTAKQPKALADHIADASKMVAPSNLKQLADSFPELNMANYWEDDVEALHNWSLEVVQAITTIGQEAEPVVLPEPVAAQVRFKPENDTTWSRWKVCAVEDAREIEAYTLVNGWDYEVRYLFTEQQVRALLATGGQSQADALDAESWVSESDSKPLESDGEVFVRFSDGTIGTGWASYWHGASDAFAQWSHPDPEEDRTVTHWMKPPTIDAAIAAAKENK